MLELILLKLVGNFNTCKVYCKYLNVWKHPYLFQWSTKRYKYMKIKFICWSQFFAFSTWSTLNHATRLPQFFHNCLPCKANTYSISGISQNLTNSIYSLPTHVGIKSDSQTAKFSVQWLLSGQTKTISKLHIFWVSNLRK